MTKVAILVWIMLGVVLAGVGVMAILTMPNFAGQELKLIPLAAIAGYIVAAPISFVVARMIVKAAA